MITAALSIAPRYRRWPAVLGSLAAILLVVVVCLEVLGWPFVAEPLQRWLSGSLHRRVSFAIDGNTPASVTVRLLGRVRIEAPLVEIGPPAWSKTAHMVRATDAVLSFHYADLWRAWRGEPLRIHMLEADEFEADIERLADGRASWQFGPVLPRSDREASSFRIPLFDVLKVRGGTLRWRDVAEELRVTVECRVSDPPDEPTVASAPTTDASGRAGLACNAHGSWRKEPVGVVLQSSAPMPWMNRDAEGERSPVIVDASVGDTHVRLEGSAFDALSLTDLNVRFDAEGSSLAGLAQVLDIRLAPRAAFRAKGGIDRDGLLWRVNLDRLQLGTSDLSAKLELDRRRAQPVLSGRIEGAWLAWRDVAGPLPSSPSTGRMLADLPGLRALDADLALDIAQVDFGDTLPRQPLKGRWKLDNGRAVWTPASGTKF